MPALVPSSSHKNSLRCLSSLTAVKTPQLCSHYERPPRLGIARAIEQHTMTTPTHRSSGLLPQLLPSHHILRILLLLLIAIVFTVSIYNLHTSASLLDPSNEPATGPRHILREDSLTARVRAKGLPKDYATGPIRNVKRRETTCQFCQNLKMAVDGEVHSESNEAGGQMMYGGNAQELWSRYCDGREVKGCSEGHEGIVTQSRL